MRIEDAISDLVIANHILAREGVVDSYGHVSVRNPLRSDRFLLSRSLSPEAVSAGDILEFDLHGHCTSGSAQQPYLERFIHAAIFAARGDVHSVVHNHASSVIPFTVTSTPIRPLVHSAGFIGMDIPIWDIRTNFGDTDMLVRNLAMGDDLARTLGSSKVALMRGHGATVTGRTIQEATIASVYLQVTADIQFRSCLLGDVKFLSPGEVSKITETFYGGAVVDRVWTNFVRRLDGTKSSA